MNTEMSCVPFSSTKRLSNWLVQYGSLATIGIWISFSCFGDVPSNVAAQDVRRESFRERLATVEKGMTEHDVESILGPADKILRYKETVSSVHAESRWIYGASKRHQVPTLGYVDFSRENLVKRVVGDEGKVIEDGLLGEDEIRYFIDLMASSTRSGPLGVVVAVNQFQSLGPMRTFALLREYHRVSESEINLSSAYIILLHLHEPKTGTCGRPQLFPSFPFEPITPRLAKPADSVLTPKYPVHLLDGVPLRLFGLRKYTGPEPEDLESFLGILEAEFDWRSEPIPLNVKPLRELENELDEFCVKFMRLMEDDVPAKEGFFRDLNGELAKFVKSRDAVLFCMSMKWKFY